ncbi:MAG: ribosome maturation factor RimM [Gemmatimonadaceae bacterium]
MDNAEEELIIVARVRKAHGIRGELVVEPMTDEPETVFANGKRLIAGNASGDRAKDRREVHVAASSPFKGGYIVRFDEIADRTAAELWRDRFLLLPAGELAPLGDDQVYVHEIPGMRVELESGDEIGTVIATYDLPQGLTLDVQRGKSSVLIPYDRVVTSIDRELRLIKIDPPEGLLE